MIDDIVVINVAVVNVRVVAVTVATVAVAVAAAVDIVDAVAYHGPAGLGSEIHWKNSRKSYETTAKAMR